ncbi:MAG TPA: protein translocase subunit SecF [Oscillospiraceae bacterium]|nr:protein translocase subunit SecF [Oscillospiraceae bacterium]
MNIVQNRKIWFSISGIILIIGLVLGVIRGVNLGIDFTGGTLMEIEFHKYISAEEVREITDKYDKNSNISMLGADKTTVQIRMNEDFNNEERKEIFEDFKTKYNLVDEDLLRANQFGPSVGREIQSKALLAIIISVAGMLIYIAFRFEMSFAISAIIALTHDVLIVLAMYSILQVPINSPFVAAILTILGYSINDTIVIFDRIRENLKFAGKKVDYEKIADDSIRQSLGRSINTSLTTLVTISALYILGVEQIREFALPLIVGVIAGTYSSIFIASPLWTMVKQKQRAK